MLRDRDQARLVPARENVRAEVDSVEREVHAAAVQILRNCNPHAIGACVTGIALRPPTAGWNQYWLPLAAFRFEFPSGASGAGLIQFQSFLEPGSGI